MNMQNRENIDVEYKQIYTPDIKKEVIAFANTEGGTVYIGIKDDGEVVGVENPDAVMQQAANAIRDGIKPDVLSFVQVRAVEMEGRQVIRIAVQTGTGQPYYLSDKGLKPSGVYVRRGSSSQPLSDEGIREMIVRNYGSAYEEKRSMNQELTFAALEMAMRERSLDFGAAQMRTLKIIGEDGLYTNLGLLLSDQCEHTVKVALFQGNLFRDRREFKGSLVKQLEDVYALIDLNNRTSAVFDGLNRRDKRDYPEEAVREALLNSIVHRDYSFSSSTIINIRDDRIEFVSLGGLVPGLSREAIFLGVSQSRNPRLAAVFYRMKLIESYGTGIAKIENAYAYENQKPIFQMADGAFRVTLSNRNFAAEEKEISNIAPETGAENVILEYLRRNGVITRRQAQDLLGTKLSTTASLLRRMCESGMIETRGAGRSTHYVLTKQQ